MATLAFITGLDASNAGDQVFVNRGFRIQASLPATFTTALSGANNDLLYTAKAFGSAGNNVSVTYAVGGVATALSVGVSGNDITVTVGTAAAVAATASVSASGVPANNNTVVVNGHTYTFKTTLTGSANEVHINGQDGSLTNLQSAINASGGTIGTDYGTGTVANADVTAGAVSSHSILLTAKSAGTSGNSLTLTEVGANLSVSGATFTGGDAGGEAASTAAQVKAAIRASTTASALVAVVEAAGNNSTGVVAAISKTNLTGGADPGTEAGDRNEIVILPGKTYQVDVDNDAVRKKLSRNYMRWIEVPGGSAARTAVQSLLISGTGDISQSFVSRGLPVQLQGFDFVGNDTEVNVDVGTVRELDLTQPSVRKAVRLHRDQLIAAAPVTIASTLVTIRGLVTSSSTPSTALSAGRGFRIAKYGALGGSGSASIAYVNSTTSHQVDLSDFNVRRALRRNVGRYIVVSAP